MILLSCSASCANPARLVSSGSGYGVNAAAGRALGASQVRDLAASVPMAGGEGSRDGSFGGSVCWENTGSLAVCESSPGVIWRPWGAGASLHLYLPALGFWGRQRMKGSSSCRDLEGVWGGGGVSLSYPVSYPPPHLAVSELSSCDPGRKGWQACPHAGKPVTSPHSSW